MVVITETLRRHFVHLGYVAALLLLIIIPMTMGALGVPASQDYGLMSLFALIAGCQLIGPEFSSGTLQLVLSKPVGRSSYLLSRFTGVVLSIWVAVLVVFGSSYAGSLIGKAPFEPRVALSAATAAALQILLTCALLTLFGSMSRSYANVAMYIGSSILISMIAGVLMMVKNATNGELAAMGRFLREHPSIIRAVQTFKDNVFPEPPQLPFDRNWILMVACNASIALLLACIIFRSREVPYGAD